MNPKSRFPKPKEKMNTRIPKALARRKWPDSWKKMMMPRTTTRATVELARLPIASIKSGGFQSFGERLCSLVGEP